MNNIQKSKHKRDGVVISVLKRYDAEVKSIPALARKAARFEEIYNKIIVDGLYSFGAKKSIDIVRGQIDRACVNSNYTIRASKDCFRFERNENGQIVYSLLTPTLIDNAEQPGVSDEGELAESEQEVINTAVAKVDSQPINTLEPKFVDFTHPECCTGCDPVSCIVEGKDFSVGNWRDVLVALTEAFLQSKPKLFCRN